MSPYPTPRQSLIALNANLGLTRDSVCRLAACLEDWRGSRSSATDVCSRIPVSVDALTEARRTLDRGVQLAAEEERLAELHRCRVVTILDASYPEALRDLELPPPVLYSRGHIPTEPAIAIVGSRRATVEGRETAELFGRELAARGLTIVSGFAPGVDLAAHRGALGSKEGKTIAVLGCGLDVDYPRNRASMRRRISERGALLTEFPFGTHPEKRNFPIRNRLIAALASGTLVVQGARRSGSLITARLALDLGRDVYAVPSSIYEPLAEGPNALIRDGALLVSRPHDIVESLSTAVRARLREPGSPRCGADLEGLPATLLELLTIGKPATTDTLAVAAGLPTERVLAALIELEISGLVKRFPGGLFCRRA